MSNISVSVGANGATTGRTDSQIPGDGEIDSAEEATAALTLLPEGSANTVKVGGREYTRAQLIEIRDRMPAPSGDGGAAPNARVSHGFSLGGSYSGGFGDYGHNVGGLGIHYVAGIPLSPLFFLDVVAGLRLNHGDKDYTTPGGEKANSAFTSYGAAIGADVRAVANVADRRIGIAAGARVGVSAFSTDASTIVSTPTGCKAGDFGRGECEPGAGPQKGNAGTTGIVNPRVGSSRGTSGVALDLDFPVTVSVDAARGAWGSLGLYGQFKPGFTSVLPSDGNGISFARMGGEGGVIVRFGGGNGETPSSSSQAAPTVRLDEIVSPTIVGKDAQAPIFEATLTGVPRKIFGSLSGSLVDPQGRPANFDFVDEKGVRIINPQVSSYPYVLRIRIKDPLQAGEYKFNYEIQGKDSDGVAAIAKGSVVYKVSPNQTLKLQNFTLTPSVFFAGHKKLTLRMDTNMADGEQPQKLSLTFKRKKDANDTVGEDVAMGPMNLPPPTAKNGGKFDLAGLDFSRLEAGDYIVVARVEGKDGQVQSVTTSVTVKPEAKLTVKGLGSPYVAGQPIPPVSLKLEGIEKVRVKVTISTTTRVVVQPYPLKEEDVTVVDTQVIEVTNAKEEPFFLRCKNDKSVQIGDRGTNPKVGTYTITFEAEDNKQELFAPQTVSVVPGNAAPAAPGGGGRRRL